MHSIVEGYPALERGTSLGEASLCHLPLQGRKEIGGPVLAVQMRGPTISTISLGLT
jgi:hypothetical protein